MSIPAIWQEDILVLGKAEESKERTELSAEGGLEGRPWEGNSGSGRC